MSIDKTQNVKNARTVYVQVGARRLYYKYDATFSCQRRWHARAGSAGKRETEYISPNRRALYYLHITTRCHRSATFGAILTCDCLGRDCRRATAVRTHQPHDWWPHAIFFNIIYVLRSFFFFLIVFEHFIFFGRRHGVLAECVSQHPRLFDLKHPEY